MYRPCTAITTLRVSNMMLGTTTAKSVLAISSRCCSTGISKMEQLLPQTDKFPSRHIGLNSETEQEMTNFLGLKVGRVKMLIYSLVWNLVWRTIICLCNSRTSMSWWIKQYLLIYAFKEKWIFMAAKVHN